MYTVSLDTLRPFAKQYPVLPVWRTLERSCGAIDAFRKFKFISRHCFILESLDDAQRNGRWTFLGFEPKLELSCDDDLVRVKNGADIETFTGNPAEHIQRILTENAGPAPAVLTGDAELPAFTGGLVGYFSFDFVKYHEPALRRQANDKARQNGNTHFKDCDLMLFDKLAVWDQLRGITYLFINIKTDALEEQYRQALIELDRLQHILTDGEEAVIPPLRITSPFRELMTKDEYCAMAGEAKRAIIEGDIFQVVLSNQLDADVEGSLFDSYLVLRRTNPSPYMFYFSSDDIEISGASPETLVRLSPPCAQDGGEGRVVRAFPLAGTRRRGAAPEEDAALERELLADPKELAEHTMLVDLGRNDLGKICSFGSVKVEKYCVVARFSHVMHLGSTVRGTMLPSASALDAIAAVLPAGTLSGAPKIRAIEIINTLEKARRGIYGGAIGYLALSGAMDTCISIRIAYKKNGKVYVRSGAGIVADSVNENEYEECNNKMRAVLAALKEAAGDSVN